jgi:hypothetical protein
MVTPSRTAIETIKTTILLFKLDINLANS